jgi:hypothetical protein
MTDKVSREDVVFSNTVSAWVDLRRDFSKQVLRLGAVAFALALALGAHTCGGTRAMMGVATAFFLIALGSSMAGMNLDIRVLSLNSDPRLVERVTKYDCAIRVFCITACACIFLGSVFTALAIFCPPQV